MKRLTGLFIGLMTFLFCSCNLDYFEDAEIGDIVFDPSVALPIGEITYSVEELFEELNDAGAEVGTTDENVVTLIYEQQLQSQSATSFLAVLDQNFGSSLASGTSVTNPAAEVRFNVSDTFEYDLSQRGNEAYDSIYFDGGTLGLTLNSNYDVTINFELTFLSLEQNGSPFTASGSLTSSSPSFNLNQSLSGFRGLFNTDSNGDPSTDKFLVGLDYEVVVPTGASVNAADDLQFDLSITNTTFEAVYGDVGTQDLTVSFDVANLDFFKQFDTGSITFADPSVALIFENSFGFPLGVSFPEFAAIAADGSIVALTGAIADNVNIASAPTIDRQGDIDITNIEINVNNSNIDDLLSAQPTKVVVDVNTETNPATGPDQYNFVATNSILDVSTRIEIPLELNLNNLGAEESVGFTNGEDLQDANRLLFRVISENELPMGGDVELQFKNSDGVTVFTVNEQAAFTAAPVGANGRTTEAVTTVADILFEEENIRAIENATSINVLVSLSTTDAQTNQAVKFFNDYELTFKLAVQADVEVNSNED